MDSEILADKARRLYAALANGDRAALDDLLHAGFVGRLAEGMPFGVGGTHAGPEAMRRDGWGAIARHFQARRTRALRGARRGSTAGDGALSRRGQARRRRARRRSVN